VVALGQRGQVHAHSHGIRDTGTSRAYFYVMLPAVMGTGVFDLITEGRGW
jgi:hypothetical protein